MAAKKIKRVKNPITKAPSGVSFMYAPIERVVVTLHAWHKNPKHRCKHGGRVYVIGPDTNPNRNRPDALLYGCTGCKWKSPSGKFQHKPTKPQTLWPKIKPRKKIKQREADSVELRDAIRAEFQRRRDLCIKERAKFPPSLIEKTVKITKGKNKGKTRTIWVSNPKFTNAMREHMSKFQFSPESIRAELLKKGD